MGADAGTALESLPGPGPSVAAARAAPAPRPGSSPARSGLGFGDVLSMLNPLQYVPVVGMIYRAVTGDTIPEPVRVAGGLAFSALTGGPIGVVLSAATEVAEQALGIDPEKIGHSVLASIGLAAPEPGAPAPVKEAGTAAGPALAAAAPPAATVSRRNLAYAWAASDSVIGSG